MKPTIHWEWIRARAATNVEEVEAVLKDHAPCYDIHFEEDFVTTCELSVIDEVNRMEYVAIGEGADEDDAAADAYRNLAGEKYTKETIDAKPEEAKPKEFVPSWDFRKYGCPTSGKGLFAWMKQREGEFNISIQAWFFGRQEIRQLPRKLEEWDHEQIRSGYDLLVRKMVAMGVKAFDVMPEDERPIPQSERNRRRILAIARAEASLFTDDVPNPTGPAVEAQNRIIQYASDHIQRQEGYVPTLQGAVDWVNDVVGEIEPTRLIGANGVAWMHIMLTEDPVVLELIGKSILEKTRKARSEQSPR